MSDIFEEYAKIAVAQGLVKEASLEKKAEEETNPRYDSLDLDAIEMLYGVKPNGEEKHIVEQSHPESVVVSPAYDRVNGLVENGLERQDIMHWIATKPNHGKHIQERYVKAHQELVNEVIKAAFILDRDNEHELMAFADRCAGRLNDSVLIKSARTWGDIFGGLGSVLGPPAVAALVGAGPWGWGIAGVAIGITALVNHFGGMIDQGVKANAENAISELQDVVQDPDEAKGYGDKIQDMISDIQYLLQVHQDIADLHIEGSEDANATISELKAGNKALTAYKKAARGIGQKINSWIDLLKAIAQKDKEMSGPQSAPLALLDKVVKFVWTPDVDDAVTALETLRDSLTESVSAMTKLYDAVKTQADKHKEDLEAQVNKAMEGNLEQLDLTPPKEEPTANVSYYR